jgi:cell division protein FtsB
MQQWSWWKAVRKAGQLLGSFVKLVLYVVFAAVAVAGLGHAFTQRGYAEDRGMELRQVREQLVQARMRGQELGARVDAFASRRDVRIQTIRSELGLVRPGEKVYVLK